jgi:hypothetical protein
MPRRLRLVPLLLLLAVPVWAEEPVQGPVNRPPCRKVIDAVNHEVSVREGRPASSREVARKLGTEEPWVLRCMTAYGRVPSHPERLSDGARENFARAMEEGRPMELDENTREMTYEDNERRMKQEAQEIQKQKKKLEQQKKLFDKSSNPFETAPNY